MIEEFKPFLAKLLDVNSIENNTHVRKIIENIKILFKSKGLLRSITTELPLDGEGAPIPWYTYPVIDYLNQLDFSRCSILEFGAGHSTLFWSKLASKVVCIERSQSWYSQVAKEIDNNNVELLLVDGDLEYIEFLSSIQKKQFDIVIIDGRDRFHTVTQVYDVINNGGILIFDNSDWYPASCSFLRNKNFSQIDFCGFGPINNYTWCTSIFFKGSIRIPHKDIMKFTGGRGVIKEDDRSIKFQSGQLK